MADKFSRGVHLHKGALTRHGWKEHEDSGMRHAALNRSVRADGYKTTIDRLTFLRNVANREDNERLHLVAESDERWLQRERKEGRI
ncbi:MAG: hypothetical protein WCB19_05710 [Thermoplasmata archaeon]